MGATPNHSLGVASLTSVALAGFAAARAAETAKEKYSECHGESVAAEGSDGFSVSCAAWFPDDWAVAERAADP